MTKITVLARAAVLLLAISLATDCIQAQNDKYFSSEQEAYYDALEYKYQPATTGEVLAFSLPHFLIKPLKTFTPYTSLYDKPSPSEEEMAIFEANLYQTEGSSGIWKLAVIKKGSLNGKHAILYHDYTFEDSGKGVWVALYDQDLKKWNKYYTGLADGAPLHLKQDSRLPLFKDGNHLQIEAAFIREIYSNKHLFPLPQLVKDGFVVEFDINKVTADTDCDGLTDIEEAKMELNSERKDTDGDGIMDSLDPNPRFKLPRTELTAIYESIISGTGISFNNAFIRIPIVPLRYAMGLLTKKPLRTMLIVSDDRHVQSIGFANERLIILTSKEYERHKAAYPNTLNKYHLSPLFKVDNMKDTYRVSVSAGPGGSEYLVKKGKNGWEYKIISSWIE